MRETYRGVWSKRKGERVKGRGKEVMEMEKMKKKVR